MASFSRVLQGLSHPAQILSDAHEVDGSAFGWTQPPRIERAWYALADNGLTTLSRALVSIGFEISPIDALLVDRIAQRRDGPAISPDHIELESGEVAASLVLRRWPREVGPGWVGHALSNLAFPVAVAIHVKPQDPIRLARWLRKQQGWQTDTGAVHDAANTLGRDDAERVRRNLIARTDRPVKAAIVLTVRAPDRATLQLRMAEVRSEMSLALADVRNATWEQDTAFLATQPAGTCKVRGAWRTLDCTSVASTWPFQPVTILHERGAPIGVTHDSAMLVKIDPFDASLRSFSGLLTGSIGSGKSFFLKLLLSHLPPEVEKRIVEHTDPPEYDGVPGLLTFNLAALTVKEQVDTLAQYINDLWALARADPRPRLLVLDELWSLLKDPELNGLVELIARRGRKYGLALWIATQQVEELIEQGKPVFDNASIKVYLQQEDRDLANLAKAANLSAIARRTLRTAARGQALVQCGKMVVLVDVQAAHSEYDKISTDPRELWAKVDGTGRVMDDADEDTTDAEDLDLGEAGSPDWGMAGVRLHGGNRRGSNPAPVAVAR